MNSEFQRITRRDKKALLSEECKERKTIEWKKTGGLFKKIGVIKGTLYARMGSIKYRKGKHLTKAEKI